MTDLDKLIEAVEAGCYSTCFTISQAIERPASGKEVDWVRAAGDGSLDAAKALHDALLRESVTVTICQSFSKDFHARLFDWVATVRENGTSYHIEASACNENPARAWLLAILKAYRAQVQK